MTDNIAPVTPLTQAQTQEIARAQAREKLLRSTRSGGSWFYWIAGLSVINTLLTIFGANLTFIAGLGATLLVDSFANAFILDAPESAQVFRVVAVVIDLLFVALFALLGRFAVRLHMWAFVVGLVLYALDSLIFLWASDWIGFAFHVFVFVQALNGVLSLLKLRKLEQPAEALNFTPA